MQFLTDMCLEPRNNRLDSGDDLVSNQDSLFGFTIRIARICMQILAEVCLGLRKNPLNLDPNYDHQFWRSFSVSY